MELSMVVGCWHLQNLVPGLSREVGKGRIVFVNRPSQRNKAGIQNGGRAEEVQGFFLLADSLDVLQRISVPAIWWKALEHRLHFPGRWES